MSSDAVRGWRVWRLGTYEPAASEQVEVFLRSCVHEAYWPPREPLEARCADHQRPSLACGCGIYAVATRDAALGWVEWARETLPNPVVVGEVQLWGRVLRFSDGYRGQYAYPYALEVHDDALRGELDPQAVVRALRESYLVDVARVRPRLGLADRAVIGSAGRT